MTSHSSSPPERSSTRPDPHQHARPLDRDQRSDQLRARSTTPTSPASSPPPTTSPHGGPKVGFTHDCSVSIHYPTLGQCIGPSAPLHLGQRLCRPPKALVTVSDYQFFNNRALDNYVVPEATKSRYFVTGPVTPPDSTLSPVVLHNAPPRPLLRTAPA
ncbi:MAG: hypothetical protein R3F14_17940 [Polyangiaceae bacterium]